MWFLVLQLCLINWRTFPFSAASGYIAEQTCLWEGPCSFILFCEAFEGSSVGSQKLRNSIGSKMRHDAFGQELRTCWETALIQQTIHLLYVFFTDSSKQLQGAVLLKRTAFVPAFHPPRLPHCFQKNTQMCFSAANQTLKRFSRPLLETPYQVNYFTYLMIPACPLPFLSSYNHRITLCVDKSCALKWTGNWQGSVSIVCQS